jgi:hypothetical protein
MSIESKLLKPIHYKHLRFADESNHLDAPADAITQMLNKGSQPMVAVMV